MDHPLRAINKLASCMNNTDDLAEPRRPSTGFPAGRTLVAWLFTAGVSLAAAPVAAQEDPDRADPAGAEEAQEEPPAAWPDDEFFEDFRWRPIGPANMSGRVTDVEGIPGTRVFYVAAAAGGVWKSSNGGVTFRSLFDAERVAAMGDLAVSLADTSIVWAGTGEEDSRNSISPGRGVYKSEDGGVTWELKGLEETQTIGRIVTHPTDPDIAYVAALGAIWNSNPERGLYRTRDGGETWELVHRVSDKAGFVDLVMHPEDPRILFASSWERVRGPYFLQSGGPGSALWKSTDGGNTWTEVTGGGFPSTEKGRIGLAIAHSDPDIMYAIVEARSAETGEDENDDEDDAETDADPGDGMRGSGLYRSGDGGRTWTWMNGNNTRPFYYSQVRVNPSDPDEVIWSSTPVRLSRDGGRTVGQTTIGLHVDHHALWWDPTDPSHIVVGNDGGVGVTWDGGGNWEFPNSIDLGQFYAISYNMDIPYRVCGGLQDNGTWCGPSRLRRGAITNHHWATVNGGDGFYAPQDMTDPDLMWAESQGGNVARINVATGARQWLGKPDWRSFTKDLRDELALLEEGSGGEGLSAPERRARIEELKQQITSDSASVSDLRYNWNTPLVQSVHDRAVFYVGANKVLKSDDWGDDMYPISPDLSHADEEKIRISSSETGGITPDVTGAELHATLTALAESPHDPGTLYAGTDDGRVWMTESGGDQWEELTDRFPGVPEGTWVSRIEPSRHEPDRFHVSFDGHRTGDFNPYVQVTDDGGATFRDISGNLPSDGPDFVHVIREDPHNESLLFVGTDVGVYASLNRGESWRKFMEGMPTVPVHDLKIHPRDRELIAGTHGRSVWIVNIAALEGVAGREESDIMVFDSPPALQFGSPFVGGESTGQGWFSAPSPPSGALLSYYLSADAADELRDSIRSVWEAARDSAEAAGGEAPPRSIPRLEMAVLNESGDTVQVVTGPVSDGLHQLYWGLSPIAVPEPLSPSERADQARRAEALTVIADSLVREGMDEEHVERARERLASGPRRSVSETVSGVAASTGEREFQERPGESYSARATSGTRPTARPRPGRAAGAGGSSFIAVNRAFNQALRDRGMPPPGGFGRGSGGQGQVEPGTYTVVVEALGQRFEKVLEVIAAPGYDPDV